MAGRGYESTDLLMMFNSYAGRAEGDGIPDAAKYSRLSKAQDAVLMDIMTTCPKALYQGPTAMTSADDGLTWTFGTDSNGYAVFPLGNAQIYPSANAYPNYPWVPGIDYLDRGTSIVMPNQTPWGGTLYWVGVIAPQAITGIVQPVLQPPQARILIVIQAVKSFAQEFVRNPGLVDEMQNRWDDEWPRHITAIRKHFQGTRSLGPLSWPFGWSGSTGMGIGAGW